MRRVLRGSFGGLAFVCSAAMGCGEPPGEAGNESLVDSQRASPAAGQSFLVAFGDGPIPTNAAALVEAAGGVVVARYETLGTILVRSARSTFAATLRGAEGVDAVGAVSAVRSVISPESLRNPASVEPKRRPLHFPKPVTGDPLSFRQWNMNLIRAPQARAITSGKKSVLVGLFDTGIDVTHPDLAGQVKADASASCLGGVPDPSPATWTNDVIGHGTFVAGIVAAKKNGVGIVGVAPNVSLAMVKVAIEDPNDPRLGEVYPDAFLCALDWALTHDWDLINASLTIDPFFADPADDVFCSDQPDRVAIVKIVRRAVLKAARRKLPLVTSTGNSFTDLANVSGSTPGSTCQVIPAQLPEVISSSAIGYDRKLAFYSNYGFGAIDLTAPGGNGLVPDPNVTDTTASGQVLSSMPPDSILYQAAAGWDGQVEDCSGGTCATYAYQQGTSASAPHVAGVAALAIGRFGKMTPDALLVRLSLAANPLPCPPSPYDPGDTGQPAFCKGPPFYNDFYGAGLLDALETIR